MRSLLLPMLLLILANSVFADDDLRRRLEAWQAGYPPLINERAVLNPIVLSSFYEAREYKLLWFEQNKLTTAATDLIAQVNAISAHGLHARDYLSAEELEVLASRIDKSRKAEMDLRLSDAFLSLVQHVVAGKVNPELLASDWKSRKRSIDPPAILSKLVAGELPSKIIADLQPNFPRYQLLVEQYEALRQMEPEDWPVITQTPAIKPGANDARIVDIRKRLHYWQDLSSEDLESDGYDAELQLAVEQFQARHGLEVDGIIGRGTIDALNVSPANRAEQIRVNLERWRWLDQYTGDQFAVVNIADYDFRLYEGGEIILRKPVIVGRKYRKTPVFSDKIKYLVLNPTWTVPYKLAVEDKLPDIRNDKDYLERMGFRVFRQGTNEEVPASEIDWEQLSKRQFPYRLVQGPGPLNALGQVKFMFPNPFDVYVHDTPSRELFSKTERAFSSGCIRLFEPMHLAELLLKPQGLSAEDIQAMLDSGETTTLHLKTAVPIHIEYWTSWVELDGTLHFRPDIYSRDLALANALDQAL